MFLSKIMTVYYTEPRSIRGKSTNTENEINEEYQWQEMKQSDTQNNPVTIIDGKG